MNTIQPDETTSGKNRTGVIERVVTWWQATRERWRHLHELQNLPAADLERLANDCGMGVRDFRDMAAMPQGVPRLLALRLQALKLTEAETSQLSPFLLADLNRTCGKCGSKRQCAADFAGGASSEAWHQYCPNASTLESLRP